MSEIKKHPNGASVRNETRGVGEISNSLLVSKYQRISKRIKRIETALIKEGFGNLTISQMRSIDSKTPLIIKYLSHLDELRDLRNEAGGRYGPGFIYVEQLKSIK